MTTLPEREQAFEAKFAHDQETLFLTVARRDKLFAGWVADLTGLDEAARQHLVAAALTVPSGDRHDDLMLEFAAATFARHGRPAPRAELAASLTRCMTQAQA